MRLSRDLQVPCVTCRGVQEGKVLSGKKPPTGETAGDLKNLWRLFRGQVGPKAARTPTQPHNWLLPCKVEGNVPTSFSFFTFCTPLIGTPVFRPLSSAA